MSKEQNKKEQNKEKSVFRDCEFLKDHGTAEKGDIRSFHKSTAQALAKHEIVKITEETPFKTIVVDKVKQRVYDLKK